MDRVSPGLGVTKCDFVVSGGTQAIILPVAQITGPFQGKTPGANKPFWQVAQHLGKHSRRIADICTSTRSGMISI